MSLWLEIFKQMEDPAGDLFGDTFDRIFPLEEKDVIDFRQELKLEKILKDLKEKFGSPDAEALEYFVLYFIENNFDKRRYNRLKEKITTSEDQEKASEKYGEFCYRSEKSKLLGVDIIERVFGWNELPSLRKEFFMKFVRDYQNESRLTGEIGFNGIEFNDLIYKFDQFAVDIREIEDENRNIIDFETTKRSKGYWGVGVNVNLRLDIHLRINDEYKELVQEKAEELVKRRLAEVSGANSMDEDELFGLLRYDDQLTNFLKDFDYTVTEIRAEDEADCET